MEKQRCYTVGKKQTGACNRQRIAALPPGSGQTGGIPMQITEREIHYTSADGKSRVNAFGIYPAQPRLILQIVHGIAEHIDRYLPFAKQLAEAGIAVFAEDHLGHGKTAADDSALGWFAEQDGWDTVCKDIGQLSRIAREQFPGIPFILFGHSMGSFLSRTIALDHSKELDGLVLSGTGWQPGVMIRLGRTVARLEAKRLGSPYQQSERIDRLAFSAYNKKFAPVQTDFDWLTNDPAEIEKYIQDDRCGFAPSPSLFLDMLDGLDRIRRPENLKKIRKDLPVYLFSGDHDPVGDMGKGVRKVYRAYLAAGLTNVELKLYPNGRHELLNDRFRDEVRDDLLDWLNRNYQ